MSKKSAGRKMVLNVLVLMIGAFFAIQPAAWGIEVKAGDVINSGNIEQYKEYFPMYMQRYIQDGWGQEAAVVIKVKNPEPVPLTKAYLEASKQNMATACE
jgi:hypothetical protein